ncbi:hypothetical protein Ssi03_58850 [Sphaerisporangium siamense]|nr:hypothetical protein Ssi03_58850 [Sphaerisporangium siamense]
MASSASSLPAPLTITNRATLWYSSSKRARKPARIAASLVSGGRPASLGVQSTEGRTEDSSEVIETTTGVPIPWSGRHLSRDPSHRLLSPWLVYALS